MLMETVIIFWSVQNVNVTERHPTKFQKIMGCSSAKVSAAKDMSPSLSSTDSIAFLNTRGLRYGTTIGSKFELDLVTQRQQIVVPI